MSGGAVAERARAVGAAAVLAAGVGLHLVRHRRPLHRTA